MYDEDLDVDAANWRNGQGLRVPLWNEQQAVQTLDRRDRTRALKYRGVSEAAVPVVGRYREIRVV